MAQFSKDIYDKLISSRINTWAIWKPSFKAGAASDRIPYDEVKFYLKPGIIFIGLNPSKNLEESKLINFHNPDHFNDRKLKECIQGNDWNNPPCPNLFGAFMTDIVYDQHEANSSNILVNQTHFKA